jgi:folate-binding protein YgfZ
MNDAAQAQTATAATRSALAVPAPELATLVVTGGDRRAWLNGLLTCDLAPLADGACAYGLFVSLKGRILADALVLLDGERVLLATPNATLAELRASLDAHLIMEDAEVAVGAFEVEMVHGPRSTEVLEAARGAGASGGAIDPTGLGGAVIFAPTERVAAIASARDAALAHVGGARGDDAAWEALRIERRVPRLGVDFDSTTYPQEAGLEKRAISFNKGCYLGQEVVCMLEMRGHVKRRLVALRVEAAVPPARGAEVLDDAGESVGAVTSAALVASAGGPVALAMVKRAKAESGTGLKVGGAAATVLGIAG